MSSQVTLKIDSISVSVKQGTSLLDAARSINIKIPTLCHHEDLCVAGNCRVCVVEQTGSDRLLPACAIPASDGMEIHTNSMKVRSSRKQILELLVSEHRAECTTCYKSGNCELQELSHEYILGENAFINLVPFKEYTIDYYSPSIIKDDSKCIRCQRCVRTCDQLQNIGALTVSKKGSEMKISTFFEKPIYQVVCTNCGQCVNRCPTGALTEKNYVEEVWSAINDVKKYVVVQTAPAVRIALGEALGVDPGEIVTGKMVAALRRLGFNSVLDTDFTADLTIIEEGHELLQRLKKALKEKDKNVRLPMTTSCSPGWIKFIEHIFPDFLPNLSSAKSPQQMFGALAKTFFANKIGVDPASMVSVSVMPCTAKKFEANRPEMFSSGYQDVDYVLTTRELALMIKQAGIDFKSLADDTYDSIMGESSGAAVIFGATGGVMEAALRTVYEVVTGREVPFEGLNITPVRGMEGVREATVKIEKTLPEWDFLEGVEVKTCVAHGLANAKKVMESVKDGSANYHFIEIMACPGGCLGGGGQPIPTSPEIRKVRSSAIYREDTHKTIRKSHENPEVVKVYKEFLGEPLGHESHRLLHTHYTPRERY
ncbi:NADH-dependent [FeFe] hydrogenase, group A6 [Natronoflexus pectinivorans]|uniref:NADH-quinone oxidoreductase subunit G/[NiFe] hydrogenase diaphorase moiety small subunit/NADP-reducing hydrogenase subunit HndD n=1 Tax=Natronoflexus pectinivorans TaxID=682526 RepID=A0A4R2GLZ3_9BACT|nr:NADH-dependent [FeFe] hydrogenase, group A6 [Natronoflexus pectinivorans]TCO09718.1 NADH-quinone oxidoreductase subunit G/[NiFe] hydrogenase diaphorase moiety small subunit/NADP-reducing hydrogenase subunit HndD [Natronoflexus pectinivorans]